jgi:hypothetical protein
VMARADGEFLVISQPTTRGERVVEMREEA